MAVIAAVILDAAAVLEGIVEAPAGKEAGAGRGEGAGHKLADLVGGAHAVPEAKLAEPAQVGRPNEEVGGAGLVGIVRGLLGKEVAVEEDAPGQRLAINLEGEVVPGIVEAGGGGLVQATGATTVAAVEVEVAVAGPGQVGQYAVVAGIVGFHAERHVDATSVGEIPALDGVVGRGHPQAHIGDAHPAQGAVEAHGGRPVEVGGASRDGGEGHGAGGDKAHGVLRNCLFNKNVQCHGAGRHGA